MLNTRVETTLMLDKQNNFSDDSDDSQLTYHQSNNILAVLDDMELELIPTRPLIKLTMTMNWTTMNRTQLQGFPHPQNLHSFLPQRLLRSENEASLCIY